MFGFFTITQQLIKNIQKDFLYVFELKGVTCSPVLCLSEITKLEGWCAISRILSSQNLEKKRKAKFYLTLFFFQIA